MCNQEPITQGRSVELVIPPVVEWHLQENSIYGIPSSYAWLVYYVLSKLKGSEPEWSNPQVLALKMFREC